MLCLLLLIVVFPTTLIHSVRVVRDASESDEPHRYKVVVVGAGVSGFTAAATLLENNLTDLLILEAAERIGGRIHTVQFGGVPIDKGAEFVHGEVDNIVYEMVTPYKDEFLTSYRPFIDGDVTMYVNSSGHVFNSSLIEDLLDLSHSIFRDERLAHFNGNVVDYFSPRYEELVQSKELDRTLSEAVRHLVVLHEESYSAADDLTQLGAWGQYEYVENPGDLNLKWKTGGYKTIFDFVSKRFPNPEEELPVLNKTLFNKEVTRITRREGDVEVMCADGSTYLADHVIVTVSLGVLKKHAASMFQPSLPEDKTKAIETIGFGCVGKVFLLFPTRWWTNTTHSIVPLFSQQELKNLRTKSVHGPWIANVSGFYPVINHDRMLCAWVSGNSCRTMEALSEDQVIDGLMELLETLVSTKFEISRPEGILRSGWGSNPFTLGSYSFRTVASDSFNITNLDLTASVMVDDRPVILFAGEATHPTYPSTVHGALASGRREAQNLLKYLDSKKK